jgi:hypothetical protein
MRDSVEELLDLSSMLRVILRSVTVEGREELRDVLVQASLRRKPCGRQGMLLRSSFLAVVRTAGTLAITASLSGYLFCHGLCHCQLMCVPESRALLGSSRPHI